MYNRLFILLIQVGYLGNDVSPTSLPQWSTLLFLLIFIMYKHITPNTIYYLSHTLSLMTYNVSIMYTAWCLTLYHNSIYCWELSIYNYFNLLPIHINIAIHYCHMKPARILLHSTQMDPIKTLFRIAHQLLCHIFNRDGDVLSISCIGFQALIPE